MSVALKGGVMIDIRDVIDSNAFSNKDKVRSFNEWKPGLEELQREFAFMCAARAVEGCNVQKVKEYFTLILFIYESGELDLLDSEEYWAADRTAFKAADRTAFKALAAGWTGHRAAYWAADRTADGAAGWAAYSVAGSAVGWAAGSAAERAERSGAERAVQVQMIKYLLDRGGKK